MPFPGLRSSEILLNIKQLFPFLPFSGFDSTTFTTPLTFKTFATKKWSQLNEIEWQILRMCKSSTSPTLLKIDTAAFRSDLLELPLIQDPADDVNELMEQSDQGLTSLLDKHAPLRKSVITIQPENF